MACEPSRSHLVGRDYSRREGVQPILLGGIPPDERVYNPSCWEESLPTRGFTTHLVGRNPSRRDGLKTSSSGGFPPDELDYVQVWQSKFAASFRQFDGFVKSANTACSSLNLQLDVIIKGLGLDLNLFVGVNLNLGGLLGAVGSLLGGILRKREVFLLN
ncbi:uncharacterized protein PGTG_06781 [Puccinia graminis f. sp. tritici CRL 75-36-700-3]|uniref:Uncharacterized protein n=1 Tax=Puccinia graminis f. sp. tritici (strain CRL 75-36-700-3 / race SCCL) TaxID=418459 RepID=E3K931_PUCGT|nr:uncharacterized protein PGTG_06781 [Puccinia graminis f. sp. tritici CRL 75-36-700-3]EFP80825.1 hypothetical protein PGTG_06781 [Puccinia graminis f. sp. tritici CRL 75-36-700-3]